MYTLACTLAFVLTSAAQQIPPGLHINPGAFIKQQTASGTVIQDPDAPVSFRLPAGWVLRNGLRWGDHETTLWFHPPGSKIVFCLYYQYPLNPPVTVEAETLLRRGIDNKVKQRQERENIPDYRIRSGSIRRQEVGGVPAISYIGEFTIKGQSRQEYMLRILGKNAKAHFFFMLPAGADLDGALRDLAPIAATLRVE